MANNQHKSEGSFKYKEISEIEKDIKDLDLDIKLSMDLDSLKEKVKIGDYIIPNALASLPMEGGDSTDEGSPTELTYRKYEKIARGGAGLIWLEAVSVSKDGRSNDKQLWLREENWIEFKKLNDLIKKAAREEFGDNHNPMTILQLNHSGRYCKVNGKNNPIIVSHKKSLDDRLGIDENYPIVSDEYLKELENDFLQSARLAKKAGFDGIDIKACHGYLLSEILSAYEREGEYGGSFENRTRLMTNIIDKISMDEDCQGLILSSRLNATDTLAYPEGWAMAKDGSKKIDLGETKKLITILKEKGMKLISLTMGNPYFIPHINKPYDMGTYTPDEKVIESCNRLISGIGEIQKEFLDLAIVGVGYSWFREFAPYIAAGSVDNGLCRIVGFGREGIAYPDFAKDIINENIMEKKKVCIACSKCSEMKSKIGTCGCVIRDSKVYLPIYREMKEGEKN